MTLQKPDQGLLLWLKRMEAEAEKTPPKKPGEFDGSIFQFYYNPYRALLIRQLPGQYDLDKIHRTENVNWSYNNCGHQQAIYLTNTQLMRRFKLKHAKKLKNTEIDNLRSIIGKIKRSLALQFRRIDFMDLELIHLIDETVLSWDDFNYKQYNPEDEIDKIK